MENVFQFASLSTFSTSVIYIDFTLSTCPFTSCDYPALPPPPPPPPPSFTLISPKLVRSPHHLTCPLTTLHLPELHHPTHSPAKLLMPNLRLPHPFLRPHPTYCVHHLHLTHHLVELHLPDMLPQPLPPEPLDYWGQLPYHPLLVILPTLYPFPPTPTPSSPPSPSPLLNYHPMQTRAKNVIIKPNPKYGLTTIIPPFTKPCIVAQALQDPKWVTAIKEEYDVLIQNGT